LVAQSVRIPAQLKPDDSLEAQLTKQRERRDTLRWRLEALNAAFMSFSGRESTNSIEAAIRAIRQELLQIERKLSGLTSTK
jgi:uncharacterized coiled-coil DUF342 family protein